MSVGSQAAATAGRLELRHRPEAAPPTQSSTESASGDSGGAGRSGTPQRAQCVGREGFSLASVDDVSASCMVTTRESCVLHLSYNIPCIYADRLIWSRRIVRCRGQLPHEPSSMSCCGPHDLKRCDAYRR